MTFFDKFFRIQLKDFLSHYRAQKKTFVNKQNYSFSALEVLLNKIVKEAIYFFNTQPNNTIYKNPIYELSSSEELENSGSVIFKKLILLNISRYAGKDFVVKSLKRNYQGVSPNSTFVNLTLNKPFQTAEQLATIILKEIEINNSVATSNTKSGTKKVTDVLQSLENVFGNVFSSPISQSLAQPYFHLPSKSSSQLTSQLTSESHFKTNTNIENTQAIKRIISLGRESQDKDKVSSISEAYIYPNEATSQSNNSSNKLRVIPQAQNSVLSNSLLLVLQEIEDFPISELDKLIRSLPPNSNILLISQNPNYFFKAKKTLGNLREVVSMKLMDSPTMNIEASTQLFQETIDFDDNKDNKEMNNLIIQVLNQINNAPDLVSSIGFGFRLQKQSLKHYLECIKKTDLKVLSKINSFSQDKTNSNQSNNHNLLTQSSNQSNAVDQAGQISNEQRSVLLLWNLLNTFPREITLLLQRIVTLPLSGFSFNDLSILCSDLITKKVFDKSGLYDSLEILVYCGFLKIISSNTVLLYSIDLKIGELIQQLDTHNSSSQISTNCILLKRLESKTIWQESQIWITQYEQTLITLKWILNNALFEEYHFFLLRFYRILGHKSLYIELEQLFLPICKQAIKESKSNESRGFWYNLLGLVLREISKYKDSRKYLQLSLDSFQKSLKFHNPQSQERKYSFVYQNIGDVYVELSRLDESYAKSGSLRDSIKAYKRALEVVGDKQFSDSLPARRALARSFHQLGRIEKPSENYQKSFLVYKEAILRLKKNNQVSSLKLLEPDLEKLKKQVNVSLIQCSEIDKQKMSMLKDEIEKLNSVSN